MDDIAADLNVPRPVVTGGTGASSAAGARTALGLAIGTDVQAYDAATVKGPAIAVDARLAVFDGTTGKLLKDGGVTVAGLATAAQGVLADAAAPKESPTLTGTPLAPTAAVGTRNTQIATTAFVRQWDYESAATAYTLNSKTTFAHGLAARPTRVSLAFRCTTAEAPYVVGDEVLDIGVHTSGGNVYGAVAAVGATSADVRIGSGVFFINNAGTVFTPTIANWRIIARASL